MSHTRTDLSREEHSSHFESGWLKHMSVILLVAAYLNSLTFFSPDRALTTCRVKSVYENAIKSFILL